MSEDQYQERAATQELLELPTTPETLHAKLDHLIISSELYLIACTAARDAAEKARDAAFEASGRAEAAREAASRAGDNALKVVQSREPLSRKERFGAVFAGAAAGGALASFAWAFLGALGLGAVFASCLR